MADDGVNTTSVSEASKEKIKLKSSDGEVFEVDKPVAMEFLILEPLYEDEGRVFEKCKTFIFLPNVKKLELSKAIEYCTRALEFGARSAAAAGDKHAERMVREEREGFEAEFVNELSNEMLKELILAVNFLEIKEMMDFLNQSVAKRIRNRSVEYVRQFFDIENDLTPQEEDQIRQENAWAFEGVDAD